MPSEISGDAQSFFSLSLFPNNDFLPGERQVGFWKKDSMPDHYASGKLVGSSPAEKLGPVGFQTGKSLEHPESFLLREKNLNPSFDSQAVGADSRAANQSLIFSRNQRSSSNVMSASCFPEGSMGPEYENSLFSSSLSEIFTRKMRLAANHSLYGHSFDNIASHYEEEEPFESLEEMEAQTIGNLLPNDNDDLFSAVTDGLDMVLQSTGGDDVDELDLFNSVGGMDLGDDVSQKTSEFSGEVANFKIRGGNHLTSGENSSRTLIVRNINGNAEDSELMAIFERYGEIRTLYTACKHRCFIVVAYYDIRAAQNAIKYLHNRLLKGTKLDLHYSLPKDNFFEDVNQGTLVIYNLDSYFPNDKLREIFGVYGDIREMHAAPHRSDHRFIEFCDIRSAETAVRELDRVDIVGKQIRVELSRDPHQTSPPSNSSNGLNGHGRALNNGGATVGVQSAIRASFLDTAFQYGISSSVPNSFPSLVKAESTGQLSSFHESGHLQGQLKFNNVQGLPTLQPHSLPEYHDGLTNGVHGNPLGHMAANINHKLPEIFDNRQIGRVGSNGHSVKFNEAAFGSTISGNGSLPANHYGWSNSYHIPRPPNMMWQNSPTFVNGVGTTTHPSMQMHGLPRATSLVPNTVLPINNNHVGSAPVVNHSLWERRHSYGDESPDASAFHPGSLGSMRLGSSPQSMEFLSHNLFSHNGMELAKSVGHHQGGIMLPGKGQMIHMMNAIDSPNERVRSRRNEGSASQADKKQYELDIEHILRGGDIRTTLMIKNIPNKYTSKMLLAAIDEQHRGTYDFIYLPIDFKNKCNVGYAFINMIDPKCIVPFYQAFNGKKWDKFNSEKVASLAYARIQGKLALVAHFQNSSLMNEDKRCRPILFNTEGPNAGDQIPFPMGVNIRTRSGKARTVNQGENAQDNSMNGEDYCNGEASSD